MTLNGTVDEIRSGIAGISIEADFRPKGHLGDETVERVVRFGLAFNGGVTLI